MAQTPLTVRRWKRIEHDRLVDLGAFEDEPLELIGAQLIVAEPKGAYHSFAVTAADYALRAHLPSGWIVRNQQPVSLDEESEPEPDLVVVQGRPADYRYAHPERPVLAIEVGHTSLYFDREHRGVSTRGPGSRITGSSTWSTASSRSTETRARTRRRSTVGGIDPS